MSRDIPFGKLRAGSRPAGENAGLRDDAGGGAMEKCQGSLSVKFTVTWPLLPARGNPGFVEGFGRIKEALMPESGV